MTVDRPSYREPERVVLARDVPEAGLRAGDAGTVVWVSGAEAAEVELVTHAGRRLTGRCVARHRPTPLAGVSPPRPVSPLN